MAQIAKAAYTMHVCPPIASGTLSQAMFDVENLAKAASRRGETWSNAQIRRVMYSRASSMTNWKVRGQAVSVIVRIFLREDVQDAQFQQDAVAKVVMDMTGQTETPSDKTPSMSTNESSTIPSVDKTASASPIGKTTTKLDKRETTSTNVVGCAPKPTFSSAVVTVMTSYVASLTDTSTKRVEGIVSTGFCDDVCSVLKEATSVLTDACLRKELDRSFQRRILEPLLAKMTSSERGALLSKGLEKRDDLGLTSLCKAFDELGNSSHVNLQDHWRPALAKFWSEQWADDIPLIRALFERLFTHIVASFTITPMPDSDLVQRLIRDTVRGTGTVAHLFRLACVTTFQRTPLAWRGVLV